MSDERMGPDLRLPIGLMFVVVAAVLVLYGWQEPAVRAPRTEFNVNLYWGLVLLAFGILMLLLGLRAEIRSRGRRNGP